MTGRPSFSSFFSFDAVVRQLVKWRVRAMARRREDAFWASHVKGVRQPEEAVACDAAKCLPPRNAWKRPRAAKRGSRSAEDVAAQAIVRTVYGVRKAGRLADTPWGRELERLVEHVNARLSRDDVSFAAPRVILKRKDAESDRALAAYENIEDRLILSGLSAYLRERFDGLLSPHCHSFRLDGETSHQSAVAELVAYRQAHAGETLYVAECDIMKFFDAVDHREALRAFDSFAAKCGGDVDPAARRLVKAYLASYSFEAAMKQAEADALGGHVDDARKSRAARLAKVTRVPSDVLAALHPGEDMANVRLGIPQGGALSPLFANILLTEADGAVVGDGTDADLLYVRFCDDMVIVHTDRATCEAAMGRYLDAVRRCRLPAHPADEAGFVYGPRYYELKTKGPFEWRAAKAGERNAAPWVSFLGYQVGFDGTARVRKETLSRHLANLRKERPRIVGLVQRAANDLVAKGFDMKEDTKKVLFLLRHYRAHLVARGVGFLRTGTIREDSLCWAAAFPNLRATAGAACKRQMRVLDAVRDRLTRFAGSDLLKKLRPYYGRPFSYYGYLLRQERPGRGRRRRKPRCSDLRAYAQI